MNPIPWEITTRRKSIHIDNKWENRYARIQKDNMHAYVYIAAGCNYKIFMTI